MNGAPEKLVGADRVLGVLIELGNHPQGATLDELAAAMQSPKPTVHRALTSLRKSGLATQLGRGLYTLGDEFMRLAFKAYAERPDALTISPILDRLAKTYGETAHYAILDGVEVVYRAKTDPPHGAVRLTSVIGGRNPAYCTAVGKLLLSYSVESRAMLIKLLGPGPFPQRTDRTLCTIDELWADLQLTRERGYAVDDQENEQGVNCVALPTSTGDGLPMTGAISVSALAFRTPLADLEREVPNIADTIAATRK